MTRRQRITVAAAALLACGLTLYYVLTTQHLALKGDEIEYDIEGRFIVLGHFFWTITPYGIAHASAWKAPVYPLWVGLLYDIFGIDPLTVRIVQVPLAGLDVVLAAVLARRLFGPRVGLAAAGLVAVDPLAWQFTGLLYPEALATPLLLGGLILILTGAPTRRRAVGIGALIGVAMLERPTALLLLAVALVAWGLRLGWRRSAGLTVLAVGLAAFVIAPWTVRNAIVEHGFLPISLQDAAAYGTFNAFSAHYGPDPYAWQPLPPPDRHFFDPGHPRSDMALYGDLQSAAADYIARHPLSVPAAFFWNGITRLWDLRPRHLSYLEVPPDGRSGLVTRLGLDLYDVLLPLAVLGLVRARRRREIVLALLAGALTASLLYTVDAGTRYRAPFEPVIAVMACVGVLGAGDPRRPGSGPKAGPIRTAPGG